MGSSQCTGTGQTCDSGTSLCACPSSGFVVDAGNCVACAKSNCECSVGSKVNCLETFFWTLATDLESAAFTTNFPDVPATKLKVAEELQTNLWRIGSSYRLHGKSPFFP